MVMGSDLRTNIRAALKRNLVLTPISPEGVGPVGTEGDDGGAARGKLSKVLAQLCQMFATVGSGKSAHQYQYDRFFAEDFCQVDLGAGCIEQFEIGSNRQCGKFCLHFYCLNLVEVDLNSVTAAILPARQ
jgi:hypothetical protein